MNVLVACEESQAVCKEFRALGHRAFSCDIQECSGGHPEWHIKGDMLNVLWGGVTFMTQDGVTHSIDGVWDLVIGHPPCTYLTISGNAWYNEEKYLGKALTRYRDRLDGIRFFMHFVFCNAKHVAIENPVGIMSSVYRTPNQIIQPYEYGDPESKKTCLWLKDLPNLVPTDILPLPESGRWANQTPDGQNKLIIDGKWVGFNDPRTAKYRAKTYPGIAKAMADQWSAYIERGEQK